MSLTVRMTLQLAQILVAAQPEGALQLRVDSVSVVRFHAPVVAHRFVGELVDSAGNRLSRSVSWRLTVRHGETATMLRLSNVGSEVRIPRPYGVRLLPADSLVVAVVLPSGAEGATVLLRMEYEVSEAVASRLPVLARASTLLVAERRGDVDFTEASWGWTAADGGRLVAIAGRHLMGADEVILEEVETGAIVWRMRMPPQVAGSGMRLHETVRPGVALVAGLAYRLRILSTREELWGLASDTPTMMVRLDGRVAASR
jgi:hypothetical protein